MNTEKRPSFILPEGVEIEPFYLKNEEGETVQTLFKGGNAYHTDRELAEYAVAIGRHCNICGEPTSGKERMLCPECSEQKDRERYMELEFQEWDGTTPVCIYRTDQYFMSEDDLLIHCEEHDVEPEDLLLVICEKVSLPEFDVSEFLDHIWDWDYDIPRAEEIEDEVNAVLQKYLTKHWNLWEEGSYRTMYRRG